MKRLWIFRALAVAMIVGGLWLALPGYQYASTEGGTGGGSILGWLVAGLGLLYFGLDHRLKLRADARADRAERREIEAHRRKMDDLQ